MHYTHSKKTPFPARKHRFQVKAHWKNTCAFAWKRCFRAGNGVLHSTFGRITIDLCMIPTNFCLWQTSNENGNIKTILISIN